MSLKAVAVSTKSLQVRWVIVPPISVYVVHIELAGMNWVEPALLADILLVDCVWGDKFVVGFLIDCLALVFTFKANPFRVPHLDFSRATN
jgi:hypothetical protein